MDKYNATYLEILMKLYTSNKPIHCSYFAEESVVTERNLFANLHFLIEKELVEKVKIFQTDIDSPFFKISDSGKKLVEKIIKTFPMTE
jgi:hypothetical protein